MATEASPRLIKAEEFLEMDLGDGMHELVRGEIIEVPPPRPKHGPVCVNITFVLESFGRQTGHGYVLSNDTAIVTERGPDTVRGADLMYYSVARWPRDQVGHSLPPVVPDLVVEVYSPSQGPAAMRRKVNEYLSAGVPMVWAAHPDRRTLAIYRPDEPFPIVLDEDDVLEDLPELPGFRCAVAEFFA